MTFNDSGSNSYASNFNVALTNPAAGSIAFNGATSFTGSNALNASTSDFIVANSGSSITTDSGGITLSANQQVTPTSGNFIGINVNNATVESTTGAVTLTGKGGNTGSNNYGVEIQAGGKVQATGASPALLSITGSADDGTSAGIMFNNGAVSSAGDVSLTANRAGHHRSGGERWGRRHWRPRVPDDDRLGEPDRHRATRRRHEHPPQGECHPAEC